MRYEKEEEKWLEWDYRQIKSAREVAASYLGIEIGPTTSNADLCRQLGLKTDIFRPQRLIRWAENGPSLSTYPVKEAPEGSC